MTHILFFGDDKVVKQLGTDLAVVPPLLHCLPGTQVEIIRAIQEWVADPSIQ